MPRKLFNMRLSENEMKMLKDLAFAEGYSTLSGWVRAKLFSGLSIDMKLNEILETLKENKK